jgi:hypothetical protein
MTAAPMVPMPPAATALLVAGNALERAAQDMLRASLATAGERATILATACRAWNEALGKAVALSQEPAPDPDAELRVGDLITLASWPANQGTRVLEVDTDLEGQPRVWLSGGCSIRPEHVKKARPLPVVEVWLDHLTNVRSTPV